MYGLSNPQKTRKKWSETRKNHQLSWLTERFHYIFCFNSELSDLRFTYSVESVLEIVYLKWKTHVLDGKEQLATPIDCHLNSICTIKRKEKLTNHWKRGKLSLWWRAIWFNHTRSLFLLTLFQCFHIPKYFPYSNIATSSVHHRRSRGTNNLSIPEFLVQDFILGPNSFPHRSDTVKIIHLIYIFSPLYSSSHFFSFICRRIWR